MQAVPADKRRQSYVLVPGNFLNRTEPVEPGVPSFFAGSAGRNVKDRLGLAHWLVSPDNPLTARVAVNRIWAQLFGTGIVETEEDFGQQGALPSNQKLLDWLAHDFMYPERWGFFFFLSTLMGRLIFLTIFCRHARQRKKKKKKKKKKNNFFFLFFFFLFFFFFW